MQCNVVHVVCEDDIRVAEAQGLGRRRGVDVRQLGTQDVLHQTQALIATIALPSLDCT